VGEKGESGKSNDRTVRLDLKMGNPLGVSVYKRLNRPFSQKRKEGEKLGRNQALALDRGVFPRPARYVCKLNRGKEKGKERGSLVKSCCREVKILQKKK